MSTDPNQTQARPPNPGPEPKPAEVAVAPRPAEVRRPYGMRDDGTAVCVNAEPGTFNHECGKPAVAIGQRLDGFEACFCEHHKWNGAEAKGMARWWEIARQ